MRRYSLLYFFSQSLKSLSRNAVMSSAAILVLMACLIVLGNFAAILYNINYNLSGLGVYNEIYCFVDTTITSDSSEISNLQYLVNAGEDVTPNSETASGAALVSAYEKVIELDNFVNLSDAVNNMESVELLIKECKDMLAELTDMDELAIQTTYYEGLEARYEIVVMRINSLQNIRTLISRLDNVASYTLTSKASGLEEMKEKYSEYPTVFDNFKNNTLPDRFTITYSDNAAVETLEYNLEHLDEQIYKVICHTDIAKTMEDIKSGVSMVFGCFLVILLVVALFVMISTIRLSVYARKNEISIMRYVGATSWFIGMPFLFEGLIIGVVSAAISFFAEKYIYDYLQKIILDSFSNLVEIIPFAKISGVMLLFFFAVAIFTGFCGSFLSVKRYSRV